MTDLAIYGAGGFGRETALMIEQINRSEPCWNLLGFYDDSISRNSTIDGLVVLGDLSDINAVVQPLALVIAIADPVVRSKAVASITNSHITFPVLVHPHALMGSMTNFFGRGTLITAGCVLTTGIVTGEFTIINLASTIGHDAKLGSFSSVMPGCNISGHVEIGECTLIGTGAKILQNRTIGKNCKIGAGAVVTKSFGDGLTLVGVPARMK
ncbi:MAG TPA: acetyltransferase [Cyclobacteriaceae bacterium]|nr:acetyltransferase [Cyclobacteriaceae bacterium]